MQTYLDCVPCFARQALQATRFVLDDPAEQEEVLRELLREIASVDLSQPPPVMAQRIHRRLRELTGSADPYRAVKDHHNRVALALLPGLRQAVQQSPDPLGLAVRYAIAGNVIDLGARDGTSAQEIQAALHSVLEQPLHGDLEGLRQAIAQAGSILYLADNAGEIVFDRLLIEQLPPGRVTVAVRGGPVLNDATHEDARTAGLHELAEVVDSGSDAPGTLLEDCSPDFLRRFHEADLVLAKGQGNFESLSEAPRPVWLALQIKCPLAGQHAQLPVGTHALLRSRALRGPTR